MVTMIYAWLDGVQGMEITLLAYAVCVLAYFGFCFLFRANRCGKCKVLLGWLVSEAACDVFWFLYYYQNGSYVNRGIGGATSCFLLPILLLAAALAVTALNHDQKQGKDPCG